MAVSPHTCAEVIRATRPPHDGCSRASLMSPYALPSSESAGNLSIQTTNNPNQSNCHVGKVDDANASGNHDPEAAKLLSHRKRAWKPKVKSGCYWCKINHQRCSEQKPVCSRCLQHGKRCVYPERIVRDCSHAPQSVTENSIDETILTSDYERCQIPSPLRPSSTVIDPKYGKYFDQFRFHVAHQLSAGIFTEFWQRSVLRESASDQCVLNAILAVGSLDRARKSDPLAASTPLFAVVTSPNAALRRKLWSEHYIAATTLYGQAIKAFQHRVATQGASSRTALILTHLLVAFEHFHGNPEAVDRLATRGLTLLQRQDSQAGNETGSQAKIAEDDNRFKNDGAIQEHGPPPSLASSIDDRGIRVAECLLQRIVSLNAMYSPMYPHSGRLVQAAPTLPTYRLPRRPLPPFSVSSSVDELNGAGLPLGTKIADWLTHAYRSAMMSYMKHEALDPQLFDDQAFLLSQITDLLAVLRIKLQCAADRRQGNTAAQKSAEADSEQPAEPPQRPLTHAERFSLERLLVGHDCSFLTVTVALDPTTQSWIPLAGGVHDFLDRIGGLLDDMTPEMRASGVLYDDLLGVSAFIAREVRDYEIRRKAMARWARMLSPSSSWDNKSCFMATMALMAAEEAGRIPAQPHQRLQSSSLERADSNPVFEVSEETTSADKMDDGVDRPTEQGVIPVEAQYMWTRGQWNEAYTEYTVTLAPRLAYLSGNISSIEPDGSNSTQVMGEKTVVLDIEDFHFGQKGAGTLDAVSRLRQYLKR